MKLFVSTDTDEETMETRLLSVFPQESEYEDSDTLLILPGGLGNAHDLFRGIQDKKEIILYNKDRCFSSLLTKIQYSFEEGRVNKNPIEDMIISEDFMEIIGKLEEKRNGKINNGEDSKLL